MTDTKPDKVISIEIGATNTDKTIIASNVFGFGDKFVPPQGDQVEPIVTINAKLPGGVRQNSGFYDMLLVLDGDCRYAFYTQNVIDGGAGVAVDDEDDNNWISWFKVNWRRADGSTYTKTYEAGKVMCIGDGRATPSIHRRWTNRTGTRSLTTFRFVCRGTKT